MRLLVAGAFVVLTFLVLASADTFQAAQDEKPKYSIAEVMKVIHNPKKGVLGRVVKGTASKEDKDKMVEMYVSLDHSKPPAGDVKDWKKRTTALVKAAREVQKGEPAGVADLRMATNCKTCHDVFKKIDD